MSKFYSVDAALRFAGIGSSDLNDELLCWLGILDFDRDNNGYRLVSTKESIDCGFVVDKKATDCIYKPCFTELGVVHLKNNKDLFFDFQVMVHKIINEYITRCGGGV